MCENDLIKLLDALRGQSKNSSVLLIQCVGNEMTIASCAPGASTTTSFSLSENSRMARNAMASAIIQMMLMPYNTQP